jgi:energy-converting hydrogenase A subunit J
VISAASEIPLFVSVAVVAFYTQSLEISSIVRYQDINGPLLFIVPLAAVAMYIVILSKMPFGPFSIVESKELVSGYKTEHFGAWRAGLEICNGLKTYVLMFMFITVFIGGIPIWWMLAGMILLAVSLSFACALSPMLSPFDSVTVQMLITGVMLGYAAVLGVLA